MKTPHEYAEEIWYEMSHTHMDQGDWADAVAPMLEKMLREARELGPPPVTHKLKCWPQYFRSILDCTKTFDVRKGEDRLYRAGDMLLLQEFYPDPQTYSGREALREIGYVMHGGNWIPEDVWVLGFKPVIEEGK